MAIFQTTCPQRAAGLARANGSVKTRKREGSLMRDVLVGTGISDDVLTDRLALSGCGDV